MLEGWVASEPGKVSICIPNMRVPKQDEECVANFRERPQVYEIAA